MRYTPREHRDLYLRRSRVALVGRMLLDSLLFVLNCRQLLLSPLLSLYLCLFNAICYHMHQIVPRSLSAEPPPRPALSAPLAPPPPRTSSQPLSSARSSHPPRARRDPPRSPADRPRRAPHPARRSVPPRRWCRPRKRPCRRARTRHTRPGQARPRPPRAARSQSGSRCSSPAYSRRLPRPSEHRASPKAWQPPPPRPHL